VCPPGGEEDEGERGSAKVRSGERTLGQPRFLDPELRHTLRVISAAKLIWPSSPASRASRTGAPVSRSKFQIMCSGLSSNARIGVFSQR
jgi:hypothetical protein